MGHKLKTDPMVFSHVYNGLKDFEIRKNDRNFHVGDTLLLQETESTGVEMRNGAPLIYTGREIECEVNYILHGPIYVLLDGWVIMGIEVMRHSSTPIQEYTKQS